VEEARLVQATEHDASRQLISVAGVQALRGQHHMPGLAFHDSVDRRLWQDTRRPRTWIIDIITPVASFQAP